MHGRKIAKKFENPIDNIIIDFCEYIGPVFKSLNFTPNMLTTISLIIALIGNYNIYIGKYELGGLLFLIAYIFDCLDGNFARRYNMVTEFGDFYDHISDISKNIVLIWVIISLNIKRKTKIYFVGFLILTYILQTIHLGCQELIYDKPSPLIGKLISLCTNKDNILYTRYIGCGTWYVLIVVIIIYLKQINKFL